MTHLRRFALVFLLVVGGLMLAYKLSTVHAQSMPSDIKHKNAGGCSAGFGSCTVTVTWLSAFVDTNYTATCFPVSLGGGSLSRISKTTTSVTVKLFYDGSGTQASMSALECIGVHD